MRLCTAVCLGNQRQENGRARCVALAQRKSCLEKCGLNLKLISPSCCQLQLLLLLADQKLLWTANSDNGSFCKDKLRRIFTPPPRFPCIAFKRYIAYLANMFQDVKFFGGKKYPVESLSWLWDRFCLCEHKDGYHTAHDLIDGGVQGFPARTATEPTWAPISANWHGDGTPDTSYKA